MLITSLEKVPLAATGSSQIICFSFFPLSAFCFIHSILICTKSSSVLFFTNYSLYKQVFDLLQGDIIHEIGSNDEMSGCSIEPAIVLFMICKKGPSLRVTTNRCLFQVVNCLFLVLLNTIFSIAIYSLFTILYKLAALVVLATSEIPHSKS
jgi:hypothetical protein